MTVPKLCKDCRHYRAEKYVDLYFASSYLPAACLRTDMVTGGGHNARECKEERERVTAHACGPDAKHWEAA